MPKSPRHQGFAGSVGTWCRGSGLSPCPVQAARPLPCPGKGDLGVSNRSLLPPTLFPRKQKGFNSPKEKAAPRLRLTPSSPPLAEAWTGIFQRPGSFGAAMGSPTRSLSLRAPWPPPWDVPPPGALCSQPRPHLRVRQTDRWTDGPGAQPDASQQGRAAQGVVTPVPPPRPRLLSPGSHKQLEEGASSAAAAARRHSAG